MKMSSGRVLASLVSVAQLSPPSVDTSASPPPKMGDPPSALLPPPPLGEEPPVSLEEPPAPALPPLLRFAPDSPLHEAAEKRSPGISTSTRGRRGARRKGALSARVL